jgi:hypothetical protein
MSKLIDKLCEMTEKDLISWGEWDNSRFRLMYNGHIIIFSPKGQYLEYRTTNLVRLSQVHTERLQAVIDKQQYRVNQTGSDRAEETILKLFS